MTCDTYMKVEILHFHEDIKCHKDIQSLQN